MKALRISNYGIEQIKSLGKIILIIIVGYALIFATSVEIIGRVQGIKEMKEYFSIIEKEIKDIYRTRPGEELKIYLDDLAGHPYTNYVICYEDGKPKAVYTKDRAGEFAKIDTFEGSRVKADFNRISLEGYILLEDAEAENNWTICVALNKSRNYGLFNSTIQIIGHIGIVILTLITLFLYRTFKSKAYKLIEQLHKFVADLAIGKIPEDFKVDHIELKSIEKYLNEIKDQLIDLKYNHKVVHEDVLIDTIDLVYEIIKKRGDSDEIYHAIIETICKKIKRAVACSFWINDSQRKEVGQNIYCKAIYSSKEEFPIEMLTPVTQLIVKESMKDGNVKIIRDFESDQEYHCFKEAYPFGAMVIPIRIEGGIIGCMCIWKIRIPYKEVFSVYTQEFARYLGRTIGGLLESIGDGMRYSS